MNAKESKYNLTVLRCTISKFTPVIKATKLLPTNFLSDNNCENNLSFFYLNA